MRWLSNLIKSGRIVIDLPKELTYVMPVPDIQTPQCDDGENEPPDEEAALSAEDVVNHARFEAREIYEQSRKQGVIEGYAKGMEQRKLEAGRQCKEAKESACAEIERLKHECCDQYCAAAEQVKREEYDFAFALASKILGKPIDRSDGRFTELSDDRNEVTGRIASAGEESLLRISPDIKGEEPKANAEEPEKDEADAPAANNTIAVVKPAVVALSQTVELDERVTGEIDVINIGHIEEIQPARFAFKDILKFDDHSIQRLLREVNIKELVIALKGTSQHVADLVLSNMSENMQETIREEAEFLGAIDQDEVEEAQQKMVQTISRLFDAGEIVLKDEEKTG